MSIPPFTDHSEGQPDPASPVDNPPRARKRVALIGGGVALALAVGAGAVAFTTLSSKGAQPDTVMPGEVALYARIDLDPSAGQKVNTVRFLSKLPKSKGDLAKDPRQALFSMIKDGSSGLKDIDYAKDVEPWLGDRLAVGVLPGAAGAEPVAVVAVQVKDEAKAKDGIARLMKSGDGTAEVTMKDGYALISEKGTSAAAVTASLAKGSLATNKTYLEDMAALGDPGIASLWADTTPLLQAIPSDLLSTTGGKAPAGTTPDVLKDTGRVAAAWRFDADYVEVAGIVRGAKAPKVAPKAGLASMTSLPDSTVGAVQVSGAGEGAVSVWEQVRSALDSSGIASEDLGTQLGLTLPADLLTLLGSSLTVAVPEQDFGSDLPTVGLKVDSPDATKAASLIEGMFASAGSTPLPMSVQGSTYYLSTTESYLDALKSGGTLGSTPAFAAAVPNADTATAAMYVDLDKIEKTYRDDLSADLKDMVLAMRSVGISGSQDGKGNGTFTMRVVSN
ncbi:MAG TPA: DUF3352 domain-containing protein [Candidatus Lustribacter sp.]|nr:DUF3352 domain-containing protein [Candidatus Lustribacter sp.]